MDGRGKLGYQTLRQARLRAGLTQGDMAQMLGCASRHAHSMKERGLRRFLIEEGVLLAQRLQVGVERLFDL